MDLSSPLPPLIICVGSGGVGKTTVAAALGLASARAGLETLVMTFDPSLRLKDALGVGLSASDDEVRVEVDAPGRLWASLLDARRTFDRIVQRYSTDDAARRRILENPYYQNLAGQLAGILEYMAVERLYEVAREARFDRVILDTPPTRQALDFLEAPQRIVEFLDSGALRIALRDWFDDKGRLKGSRRFGPLGRKLEGFLDRVVGLELLRDMNEFFLAFGPLFDGFRRRASEVEGMLRDPGTRFVQVAGPGEDRIPDLLFFARRLEESGHHLGPVIVNRIHPAVDSGAGRGPGVELLAWLAERDRKGLEALRALLPKGGRQVLELPLLHREPTSLSELGRVADLLTD